MSSIAYCAQRVSYLSRQRAHFRIRTEPGNSSGWTCGRFLCLCGSKRSL